MNAQDTIFLLGNQEQIMSHHSQLSDCTVNNILS